MLNTDSAQRNAVIGCSQGLSHVQRDFSWGHDRLLGTALSQTRSISALARLRAGSCSALFRGVMQRKCENFQRVSCLPLIYILLKDDPSSIPLSEVLVFLCVYSSHIPVGHFSSQNLAALVESWVSYTWWTEVDYRAIQNSFQYFPPPQHCYLSLSPALLCTHTHTT